MGYEVDDEDGDGKGESGRLVCEILGVREAWIFMFEVCVGCRDDMEVCVGC